MDWIGHLTPVFGIVIDVQFGPSAGRYMNDIFEDLWLYLGWQLREEVEGLWLLDLRHEGRV